MNVNVKGQSEEGKVLQLGTRGTFGSSLPSSCAQICPPSHHLICGPFHISDCTVMVMVRQVSTRANTVIRPTSSLLCVVGWGHHARITSTTERTNQSDKRQFHYILKHLSPHT